MKITFSQLYAKARRSELEIQKRASFDGSIDGLSAEVTEWFKPSVEQLKKVKDQGGRLSDANDLGLSIYSHVEIYRVRFS